MVLLIEEMAIALAKISFVLALVFGFAVLLTWAERKQPALMQDRLGANRAPILGLRLWGLFHSIAETFKLIFKEDFVPPSGLQFMFRFAPVITLFPALVTFAVIPFGNQIEFAGRTILLQVLNLNIGILFLLAFGSIAVYGIVLGGWASNNKYSLIGGMRAAAQTVSYEVAIGLSIIGPIMVFGTLELGNMVRMQNQLLFGWLPMWGVVLQPLAFLIYLPAAIAETKRTPFDLPEGESEIIGFNLEYSGMRWGMFFLGEFIELVVLAGLMTTLFFGGYHIPYLYDSFEMSSGGGFIFPWGATIPLSDAWVVILRIGAFAGKIAFFLWLQLLVRWTMPRFRYDQLMRVGWKMLIPIALLNIALTGIVLLVLQP
ncbi:MAG: complex I subunit 1 family protein [bacterium]